MNDADPLNSEAQSGYVKTLKTRIKKEFNFNDNLNSILEFCDTLDKVSLPPLSLINNIGSFDYDHFKIEMKSDFEEIFKKFKINSHSKLLEIGCGCGKAAIPLSKIITDGKYIGVDVNSESVGWLQNKFENNPCIEFELINPTNNYYQEDFAEHKINQFNLNIENETIDLVFGFSVFTHLIKRDIESYLAEFYRIVNEDGLLFLLVLLLTNFSFLISQRRKFSAVKFRDDGFYQAYKGQDFFVGLN